MCSLGKVSLIVPTHKGRNLDNLIKSVYQSNYSDMELIIVDEGKERSVQRNIGVARSAGDFLLFLDSDMSIHPRLLSELVILSIWYDGLYIPEIIVNHPIKTFFRSFYNTTRVDAIRFIKREFWQPFDETLTGVEDWDWDRRFKGTKGISFYPLYHHTESNLKKKLYYAKWIKEYKNRYPNCPELSLRYRLFTVFIEKGKWRKFLLWKKH